MKKSFSLIEIMIAIFIISLLTTTLTYYMTNMLEESRVAKVKEDVQKLKEFAIHYKNDLLGTRKEFIQRRILAQTADPNFKGHTHATYFNIGSFCSSGPIIDPAGVASDQPIYLTEGMSIYALAEMKYIEEPYIDPWGRPYEFAVETDRPNYDIDKFDQDELNPYNVSTADKNWVPAFELYVGCISEEFIAQSGEESEEKQNIEGYWVKVGDQKY